MPSNVRTWCISSSAVPGFSTRVPASDVSLGSSAAPPNWNASVLEHARALQTASAAAARSSSAARNVRVSNATRPVEHFEHDLRDCHIRLAIVDDRHVLQHDTANATHGIELVRLQLPGIEADLERLRRVESDEQSRGLSVTSACDALRVLPIRRAFRRPVLPRSSRRPPAARAGARSSCRRPAQRPARLRACPCAGPSPPRPPGTHRRTCGWSSPPDRP